MKNFIFDLYNTLIDIRTDEHRQSTWTPVVDYFAERGITADGERLAAQYDEFWYSQLDARKKEKKFAYPEGDVVEVFREMAKAAGGEFSREAGEEAAKCMRRASYEHIRLFDGTKELLVKLRGLGAKVYLLSNAQAAITYDEIDDMGLSDRFDGMLLSSECGCRKPDPKFFKMLFDKYGLDKRDSIMIGDDKDSDIAGAKAFGIKFLHVPGGAANQAAKIIKLAGGKA